MNAHCISVVSRSELLRTHFPNVVLFAHARKCARVFYLAPFKFRNPVYVLVNTIRVRSLTMPSSVVCWRLLDVYLNYDLMLPLGNTWRIIDFNWKRKDMTLGII